MLTATGETLTATYDPGELSLPPGYYSPPVCKELDESSPYGTDYVETWVTYYDPTTDKLIESLHLLWDDSYEGAYARVNTTASKNGAVEGHTSRLVKDGRAADTELCS